MEHQSAVAYGNHFANGYLDRDWTGVGISPRFDFIIIHESAHEWFGNSITAADRSDMWIHEAWATYLESLYVEYMYGPTMPSSTSTATSQSEKRNADRPAARHQRHPAAGPVFQRGAVHQYAAQHRQRRRPLVAADARFLSALQVSKHHDRGRGRFFNEKTGMNLTPVFDQYLRHAAIPTLELKFNAGGSVEYRWQADVPDFAMPVRVGTPDHWQVIHPTTEWATLSTPLKKGRIRSGDGPVLHQRHQAVAERYARYSRSDPASSPSPPVIILCPESWYNSVAISAPDDGRTERRTPNSLTRTLPGVKKEHHRDPFRNLWLTRGSPHFIFCVETGFRLVLHGGHSQVAIVQRLGKFARVPVPG
jgi:hypothetical protein